MSKFISTFAASLFVSTVAFASVQADAQPLPSFPYPAQTSSKDPATSGTWIVWNNVRVNVRGGVKLNTLHAQTIRVFVTDVDWEYTWAGVGNTETAPNGDGGSAVAGYNFPGKPVEGIILYQGTLAAPTAICALPASATAAPGKLCTGFSNTADIMVAVNDGTFSATDNTGHDDNGGSFDLHVKIVLP